MNKLNTDKSYIKKFIALVLSFGPGIFAVDYTIATGIATTMIVALIVPVIGANSIQMQTLSQVFNVSVLPILMPGIILLVNNKKIISQYKASLWINNGLLSAMFFSCLISYNGVMALPE